MLEYANPASCDIYIDLDCNDSSGATDADYNSPDYDCLSDGVGIADEDIKLFYDAIIDEMTIQVVGFTPDAPNEILDITGFVPNINAIGAGTDMITLTNAGGGKSTDFKDALRLVVYKNTALLPTAGLRTVEVQFTTESGSMSNIATAFIQVNELPLVDVDLGPDQEACDGETATFDAGNPGAVYDWSTGHHTQMITVGESGEYIVTVSDGFNCPNQDTVLLNIIPVIHVSLTGDTEICDNEAATLIINTDSPFPLTVEISADPGSPFSFDDVTGTYTFTDLPQDDTEYTITNVIPSQPACIEITDPEQIIDVYPAYVQAVDVSICDGDSIWLGFYWETEAGVYENTLATLDGCDSTVTTTITILPAVMIAGQSTTCDPAEVGIFITHIDNPNGCDTVVQTTVSLLPSDTTNISLSDCNVADTGVFTQVLTNIEGCDSLIVTTVTYTVGPITSVSQTSCDSGAIGIFPQLFLDQSGCDSVVITTITMAPSDTSYASGTSCIPSEIGVFETLLSNQDGCDSLIITTVSAGVPDTTYLTTTSCDSASLGVFEEHFNSQGGCDSTVFTTVTYSASDSTFLLSSSCDPDDVGVFVTQFINRFGCDSIVTETIDLLPADATFINSTTCNPAEAGVFMQTLTNQHGCDSIVTTTIELLPSDETFLSGTTCMSSEAGTFITTHFNQNGCDSIVTLIVSLVPADTTLFLVKTCDPAEVGNIENTFINIDGCDSLVIEMTSLYPLPQLSLEVTSDFNGHDISCAGESDGSAIANISGVSPYSYIWSTGGTDQSITSLIAGSYTVTITDGNGCKANGEIVLFDPPPFSISFVVSQPDCFDNNAGSITAEQTGGALPVRYSIDGVNYQSSPSFDNLSGGTYTITALDANDCEVKEIIWINVPLMVHVEVGDDQVVPPGDTSIIQAIVNVPFDSLSSVTWSGLLNPPCPNCLTQMVAPIITTTYSVTVATHDGCMDADSLTLFVERNIDVYVPNIFSPNGDDINDRLLISAGDDVEEISLFQIFDRWGNMVFSAQNFQPNDVSNAWDGKMKGKAMNPAVYAYKMIAEFSDGREELRTGSVTLVK